MNAVLLLKNVEVTQGGKRTLEIPELDVRKGEILVILGPTGSGKSTTLKLMAFLIKPQRGEVFWQGEKVHFPAPLSVRRSISMTFQDPLPFEGSVFENVAFGLKIRGIKGEDLRVRVEEILELLSIAHLKDKSAKRISGGEAQKVALARALIFHPSLLLLDEPLASLDPLTKKQLESELYRVLKQLGITCVYVTHDQEEALSLADRIAILDRGRILQIGAKEEVFFKPNDVKVARFVGVENLIPAEISANEEGLATMEAMGKTLEAVTPFPPGARVIACIRPEEVTLKKDGVGVEKISARNQLSGKVLSLETLGPVIKVSLDCGLQIKVLITRRSASDLSLKPGDTVLASFKATAVHVIPEDEGE